MIQSTTEQFFCSAADCQRSCRSAGTSIFSALVWTDASSPDARRLATLAARSAFRSLLQDQLNCSASANHTSARRRGVRPPPRGDRSSVCPVDGHGEFGVPVRVVSPAANDGGSRGGVGFDPVRAGQRQPEHDADRDRQTAGCACGGAYPTMCSPMSRRRPLTDKRRPPLLDTRAQGRPGSVRPV